MFRGKSRKAFRLGFGFQPDGVGVVVLDPDSGGRTVAQHMRFYPHDPDNGGIDLGRILRGLRISKSSGVCVLDPANYSLLQVETPQVEPAELRSAIRWRIKDLIDCHIDDVTIDIFELPASRRPGITPMLSAVAAKNSVIRDKVAILDQADIDVSAIDIAELAIRNVAALQKDDPAARVVLYLASDYGLIEVLSAGLLYLSRRIDITAPEVDRFAERGAGDPDDDLLESLALELQRSMDYYESHFGEGAVRSVEIFPPSDQAGDLLLQYVSDNVNVPVTAVRLSDSIEGLDEVPPDEVMRCLPALGGALRAMPL